MTMEEEPVIPVTDAEINALLDNAVHGPERLALEARMRLDASARERLNRWRAQRESLRALHAHLLDEPVPQDLLAATRTTPSSGSHGKGSPTWWRWGGIAASVWLAFGAGWFSHTQWSGNRAGDMALVARSSAPGFLHDASLAYAVYTSEKRHPVEVTASEQAHLVQWLSKRTGRDLKVPDLSAQGYALVGGRLLPGEAGARAQFMFEDPKGQRVTLYLGAVAPSVNPSPQHEETSFRFSNDGSVPAFYWVDRGFGYALSGALPHEALMALANSVYRQL
jgi:anti-sigma factor RsiW